jgi:hypothetical protein
LPHIVPIGFYLGTLCVRWRDRGFGCDSRSTGTIIQEDYDEMYSGPEFILHMRYAQLLTCIFITMTFSSAMPFLYVVMMVILAVTYMVDKWLLLNYYRFTPGLTKRISAGVLGMLPLAVIVHIMFGLMALSYPGMLRSSIVEGFSFGYETHRYFSVERFGQRHMSFFCVGFVILLALVALEDVVVRVAGCVNLVCRAICCKKAADTSMLSDDLYQSVDFEHLYFQLKQVKRVLLLHLFLRKQLQLLHGVVLIQKVNKKRTLTLIQIQVQFNSKTTTVV